MESIQQDLVAPAEELSEVASTTTDKQYTQGCGEGSLFTMSPKDIWELVYSNLYSVPENDISFDVHSLFSASQNIMASAVEIIDQIVLHKRKGIDVHLTTPYSRLSSTLCNLIKSFGCEISCKCPGDEIVFASRTLEILTKLSSYPCEQQAVLALAVFVLEYEETQQFAKLCAIFDQEPDPPAVKQANELIRGDRVIELNKLIMATLQVLQHILELKNVISTTDDTPNFGFAVMDTSFNVYWSIITIVACGTELTVLTAGDQDITPYDLSQFSERINVIVSKLKERLTICQQEKGETPSAKRRLRLLYDSSPTNIKDVFNCLIFFKDKAYPQQPIFSVDSTNNELFDINVLEGKYVLLFISNMDNINDTDISRLKEFDERVGQTFRNCKIVWIPIVEDWTKEGIEEAFKEWRSKMPWYAVQYFSPAAIEFLKEWGFEGNPIGVLMNEKGEIEDKKALDVIRSLGGSAIYTFFKPFNKDFTEVYHASAKVVETLFYPNDKSPRKLFKVTTNGNVALATTMVSLKQLERKNLFLLISRVNISPDVITYLKPLHHKLETTASDYKIVWIPIAEKVDDAKQQLFSKKRLTMPWYAMYTLAPIPNIRYIKTEWAWRNKPMVVLLTCRGNAKYRVEIESNKRSAVDTFRLLNELP